MRKIFSILLVSLVVFFIFSAPSTVVANASKKETLSTKIHATKSFESLEKVLTTAKWQVDSDVEDKEGRFLAYKDRSSSVLAVRSQKMGGYFIDIIAINPKDKDILETSRKLLNLMGVTINTKQFTTIVNSARKANAVQIVDIGKHKFYVAYSVKEGYLQFQEAEGENHFK
ncbi:hypothetical protein [Solibacillus sp. FSL H8-0538]|uniref:hypothetical protein n=1 Tax=Solibacillus sp. FSL H8-0538 TaxID=2921400 RepID=UPI0030FAF30C